MEAVIYDIDDLSERTRRFGCMGSLALVLSGIGLIVWGGSLIKASEANWWGWICLAIGIILLFIGGGWTFFDWIWFPW